MLALCLLPHHWSAARLPPARVPPANCAYGSLANDPRCESVGYVGNYPTCALFQYDNHEPIPCQGNVHGSSCDFVSANATTPPTPASFHVHVFFPNPACINCTAPFTKERANFTFAGAMELRATLAAQLNRWTHVLTGQPPVDPIDVGRAAVDPDYNQCGDTYNIVAGAPANYHPEPCIFEVDAVKKMGPFTDPHSRLGYPNYSFLIPGETWLPGLMDRASAWLRGLAGGAFGAYDVLLHPNTGCEVRDHVEARSIMWLGAAHPLLPEVFSCKALGCNQACPQKPPAHPLPPPANCSDERR